MPDRDRITSLDLQLAHEEWRKIMDANLRGIRSEPVNTDFWTQAHFLNMLKDNDLYRAYREKASAPPRDPDPSTSTPTRP